METAPTDPEEPSPEVLAAFEFVRSIHALTPRAFVARALIAANVVVFVAMVAIGRVGLMEPTTADLVRWGASFGPRTTDGEWWRLLTATFIHIGAIHIAFNMYVLADAGPLVERLFGNGPFLVLYLLSGLGGALASVVMNPAIVSAGASGAIFGVYGALLAFVVRRRDAIPPAILQGLKKSAFLFVAYNLAFGFAKSGIDNSAHVGGLVTGFLAGLALAQELTPAAAARRGLRAAAVAVLGLLLLAGGARLEGTVSDVGAELERAGSVEGRLVGRFNESMDLWAKKKLPGADFAARIETELLPPWRASIERLEAMRGVPPAAAPAIARFLRYMRAREEGWKMYVGAVRDLDVEQLQRARAKSREADALVEEINRLDGQP